MHNGSKYSCSKSGDSLVAQWLGLRRFRRQGLSFNPWSGSRAAINQSNQSIKILVKKKKKEKILVKEELCCNLKKN